MAKAIKLKKLSAEKTWELIDQYADIFEMASLVPGAGNILAAVGKTLAKRAEKRVGQETGNLQKKQRPDHQQADGREV